MKGSFLNIPALIFFLLSGYTGSAQSVAINTDSTAAHASAILDIKSTTKGILIPRMTTTQRIAVTNPATGLLVFDSTTKTLWSYSGTSWSNLIPNIWWKLAGNAGTNPVTDFIGTTDNKQLRFGANNQPAGYLDPSTRNIAFGIGALPANPGNHAIAIGDSASYSDAYGEKNIAIGNAALYHMETGSENIAIGWRALYKNWVGSRNTGIGKEALFSLFDLSDNTAIGYESLYIANGSNNTAIGAFALRNRQGFSNTAIGYHAGDDAGSNSNNTMIGAGSDIAASNSTVIGQGTFTNTNNLALLGNPATAYTGGYTMWSIFSDGRFKTRVDENVKGLDFITRLRPVTYHMDVRAIYNLWGISPYGKNDSLMRLERKKEIDEMINAKESIRMSGFIAQEVEQAAKESGYDFDGVMKPTHDKDHYRIAYAEFVVPLVKGMQEQQVIIQQQQDMIREHTRLILQLREEIKLLKEK